MEQTQALKKVKIFAIIVVSVLVLIAAILAILDSLKNAHLIIMVAPIDAQVKINGKDYSPGNYRMFPGKVHVTIAKDGFKTEELDVELQSKHTETVYAYLVHNNDGMYYYEADPNSYEILKIMTTMKGSDLQTFVNEMEEKIAIREKLPLVSYENIDGRYYGDDGLPYVQTVINDGTNLSECGRVICLSLITNSGSDQAARNLLKKYGYDYNDYYIIQQSTGAN